MSGILHSINDQITPTIIGQAADTLGEKDIFVAKAMRSAVPIVLAGIIQCASRPKVLETVFQTLRIDAVEDNPVLPFASEDQPIFHRQLAAILGEKLPAIHSTIASFSGVSPANAPALLALTMPIITPVLYQHISTNDLDSNGLIRLLLTEKRAILNLLPPTVQSILGIPMIQPSSAQKHQDPQPRSHTRWLWPLVLLVILGGSIIFYMKKCAVP